MREDWRESVDQSPTVAPGRWLSKMARVYVDPSNAHGDPPTNLVWRVRIRCGNCHKDFGLVAVRRHDTLECPVCSTHYALDGEIKVTRVE